MDPSLMPEIRRFPAVDRSRGASRCGATYSRYLVRSGLVRTGLARRATARTGGLYHRTRPRAGLAPRAGFALPGRGTWSVGDSAPGLGFGTGTEEQAALLEGGVSQRHGQGLREVLDGRDLDPLPDFRREVFQVRLVVLRDHDARDARPDGAEDLLLQAADRQDSPGDRDLA